MSKRRQVPRNRGFTLVELIMVIVLLGTLAAVASNMLSDSFTSTRMVNAGNASEAEARYAMERMAREIREIKYASSTVSPSTYCSGTNTNQYCITAPNPLTANVALVTSSAATGKSFSFVSGSTGNTVVISANGNKITLNGFDLCDNVTSLTFSFLDINDGTSATLSSVKFVVVELQVKDAVSGLPLAQRVRIALRNS